MGAARNLFLAVYGAGGIIKMLFLPICYFILFSPFITLLAIRYQLHTKLPALIPLRYTAADFLPQVFISLVAIFLATRVISGRPSNHKNGGPRRIQLNPYWIPFLRNWGDILFGGERWLKSIRDASITNIFAYDSAGAKHNVILSPTLLEKTIQNKTKFTEADIHTWTIPRNAFLLPNSSKKKYLQLRPSISETLHDQIWQGQPSKKIISASLQILSDSLPDLISFNSSIVDQAPWERVSDIELTDGTEEAECELYTLINEYFCSIIIPPIFGSQFAESYQLLATDLATINKSFWLLALGLPRWIPIPGLPAASFARKRMLHELTEYFRGISNPSPVHKAQEENGDSDSEAEETDAEASTPLTALNVLLAQHNFPIQARAPIALELLHSIVSEVVPLAFWTLLNLYSSSPHPSTIDFNTKDYDPDEASPLERMVRENRKFAVASQPPSVHPSFPSPPQIVFSQRVPLFNPFVRSCIEESRRIYGSSIGTVRLTESVTISEPDSIIASRGTEAQNWILDTNSYLDLGLSQTLINTSTANFLDAAKYKHGRFLFSSSRLIKTSASHSLIDNLLIGFLAGVVQLWDFAPAPRKSFFEKMQGMAAEASANQGDGDYVERRREEERKKGEEAKWWVPRTRDGFGVMLPRDEVRVRIRRRENLPRTGIEVTGAK